MTTEISFKEAVSIEFPDLNTTISRTQVKQIVDKYKIKYPKHIVNDENRVSRGLYFLEKLPIEEISLQKSIELKSDIEIPLVDKNYVPFGFYKDLSNIIKSEIFYPIFISGHTGNGKTKMVEQVCANLNKELIRINISIDTDETDLVGGPSLENGNIIFKDGPVLTAMRKGVILLIDECDRGSSKLLSILSILEGSSYYNKKTGETIIPKPGFNIIATANSKGYGSEDGKYLSQIIDQAFLERFGITVEQEYPDIKTETKILSKVLTDKEFIDNLVKWANVIRETFNQGGVEDFISTRRLIHIAKAFEIFKNKKKAIELCISRFDTETKVAFIDLYNKIDSEEDVSDGFYVPLNPLIVDDII